MIHPSYQELMEHVNKDSLDEAPVISSRYSIVLATSKRARQLTNGADPKVVSDSDKMLSVAVKELYEGQINIIPGTANTAEAGPEEN